MYLPFLSLIVKREPGAGHRARGLPPEGDAVVRSCGSAAVPLPARRERGGGGARSQRAAAPGCWRRGLRVDTGTQLDGSSHRQSAG